MKFSPLCSVEDFFLGFVELFIAYFDILIHLKAFRHPRYSFWSFRKKPIFLECCTCDICMSVYFDWIKDLVVQLSIYVWAMSRYSETEREIEMRLRLQCSMYYATRDLFLHLDCVSSQFCVAGQVRSIMWWSSHLLWFFFADSVYVSTFLCFNPSLYDNE